MSRALTVIVFVTAALLSEQSNAADIEAKVVAAFEKQKALFQDAASRAKKNRLTKPEREFLAAGDRRVTSRQFRERIDKHIALLEQGKWTGPAPDLKHAMILSGAIGRFQEEPRKHFKVEVSDVLADGVFLGWISTMKLNRFFEAPPKDEAALNGRLGDWTRDARQFGFRGFKRPVADGSQFFLWRHIVAIGGPETIGRRTVLVIEPVDSVYERAKRKKTQAKSGPLSTPH